VTFSPLACLSKPKIHQFYLARLLDAPTRVSKMCRIASFLMRLSNGSTPLRGGLKGLSGLPMIGAWRWPYSNMFDYTRTAVYFDLTEN
jgi:hypothetical protein